MTKAYCGVFLALYTAPLLLKSLMLHKSVFITHMAGKQSFRHFKSKFLHMCYMQQLYAPHNMYSKYYLRYDDMNQNINMHSKRR